MYCVRGLLNNAGFRVCFMELNLRNVTDLQLSHKEKIKY